MTVEQTQSRTRPAIVPASLALILTLAAAPLQADAPLTGSQPAQWRVVWHADPATSATVLWSTAEQASSSTLRFRAKDSDAAMDEVLAESGRYTGGSTQLYHHRARMSELQPDTAYEIQMVSDANESPLFYFTTAPADDRPLSILHGGDSRSDSQTRRQVNRMMAKLVADAAASNDPADDILALAHGGDYIVTGTNMDLWSSWMTDHELTTGDDGRLLPIIPARGNHDKGAPFNEVFGFPADDPNYYAINLSSQIRLVTLNSEISTAGEQAAWLADELAASRPQHRWLLVQYHRPVYPAVKGPGAGLLSWVPLFEKYNVDLVCESDGHVIKRTVPIRDDKQDPSGVVYIGEGGLGVPQRTPKTDRWYLQPPGMAAAGHHVFVLTFDDKTLRGRCVGLEGQEFDSFVLQPRQRNGLQP